MYESVCLYGRREGERETARTTLYFVFDHIYYLPTIHPSSHIHTHTLTGALATLAAADLHTNHSIVIDSIYTFGSPRVGNQPFAMFYTEALTHTHTHNWRVVHAQDPVPHVPPVLLGFWHAPREVWYNEGQESYRVCDSTGEDYTCSNQNLFQFHIKDHENYLGVPF